MAATAVADSTNAVEVADFLKEAVAAGTASEAVRSVLSSNEGAEFAELLVQQLGERVPPKIDGAEEVEKLKREVVLLQKALAAKDATMEVARRDQEWLDEGREMAYGKLLAGLEGSSSMSGSGDSISPASSRPAS